MSIFRRRASQTSAEPVEPADDAVDDLVDDDVEEETQDAVASRSQGPWDAAEVDGLGDRLDLGAVWLAPVPGAEIRLEIDQSTDTINGLQIVIGESAAQVQAFAAPRSGGVWRDVRREISGAISGAGGTVDEVDGDFARELRVRMPQLAPDGRQVFAPARFIGVDGPRWFLRAVLSGQAAIDDAAAAPLVEALRSLVVVRGAAPMAPREMLPLRLPEQPAPAPAEQQPESFDPFERGPEITEVR